MRVSAVSQQVSAYVKLPVRKLDVVEETQAVTKAKTMITYKLRQTGNVSESERITVASRTDAQVFIALEVPVREHSIDFVYPAGTRNGLWHL